MQFLSEKGHVVSERSGRVQVWAGGLSGGCSIGLPASLARPEFANEGVETRIFLFCLAKRPVGGRFPGDGNSATKHAHHCSP
jgi:hypothetical protein